MMVPFISIFGPDGSGKSTHARILADYLVSKGFDVRIVWIKSFHTLAYVLSKIIEGLSPRSVVRNAQYNVIRINSMCCNRFNRLLWSLIEFISIIPLVLLRVYIPLLMGKIVITERYIVDSIASIAYALDNPEFDTGNLANIMLHFIPKEAILIHLDSDYETVKSRRLELTDPKDFFQFQRKIYDKLSKRLNAFRIDTAWRSVEETAFEIRKLVAQRFTNNQGKCHRLVDVELEIRHG